MAFEMHLPEYGLGCIKRIWYLLPMRAAMVQARSLARTSTARSYKQWVNKNLQTESQSLAPLNGWACAVKICHDGMLEDTNLLDAAHLIVTFFFHQEAADNATVT